ncbi:MAG: DUF547 domain-containing protein [Verrucomicrobiota bacterium]
MKTLQAVIFLSLLLACGLVADAQQNATGKNVRVRAGVDHSSYDRLLKKYVNEQGLVNYGAWKQNGADVAALNDYLKQMAGAPEQAAKGNERVATLANAYNAIVLQWILTNYPTESIWALKDSFKAARHTIGGENISLNDIENGSLRPEIGWHAHAVLVCAARSCPPLQRSAYSAGDFEDQDVRAFRAWLGREDLNKFTPAERRAEVSSIFKWFKGDFDKAGGVPKILGRFAPESARQFAGSGNYDLKYLPYNWGLNDQGSHGRNYSRTNLVIDNLFK